jgi:hypothetical protein
MALHFDDLNNREVSRPNPFLQYSTNIPTPQCLTYLACVCFYALSTRYFIHVFERPTALEQLKWAGACIACSLLTCYFWSWDPRVGIPRDLFLYGMADLFRLVHQGGPPDLEPPPLTLPLIEALVITTTVLGQLEREPLTVMTLIGGGGELITVLLIYYWQNPPRAEAASAVREKELQEQRLVKLMLSIALVIVSTTAGIAGLRLVSLLSGAALCGVLRLYT